MNKFLWNNITNAYSDVISENAAQAKKDVSLARLLSLSNPVTPFTEQRLAGALAFISSLGKDELL